jgi:gliding motility-associated-like protein
MKFFYALAAFLMLTHAAFAQYYYEDVSNNPTNPRYYFEIPVGYSKASIEANGAEGGYFIDNFFEIFQPGGAGAYVAGDFILSAGDTIEVLIGGKGADGSIEQGGGGGGGGTFVFRVKNGVKTLLLAAGGGGGAGIDSVGKNGDFNDGIDVPGNLFFGSGGASFSSNATGYVTDAISLGEGATTFYDPNCSGGFGGGGAGAAEQGRESGGGGGGYGGGNGATANGAGGWGGTSFINPIATNTYRDVLTFFGGAAFSMYLYCDPIPRDSFKTICYGDSFFFKNEYLKTTGTYSDTIFGYEEGCDTVINLHLTVRDSLGSTTNVVICEGETFQYLDETLSQAGTYTYTRFSANGCDSVVTINLSVNPKKFGSFTQSICSGSTYFFNGNNLTQAGSYKDTLQAATTGCDSIVTLELIVLANSSYAFSDSICNGSSYVFGSQTLTQAGTYSRTIPAANGCDSVITLNLIVKPTASGTLNQTICAGSSFFFNNQNLTQAGTYTQTLSAANGCDSMVTLNLTVLPNAAFSFSDSICNGSSYAFGNQILTQAGTYSKTIPAANGCDSLITLNLKVLPVFSSTTNVAICNGESFTYLNEPLYDAGVYTFTLSALNGCDSIVTINLSVGTKPKLNIVSLQNPACNGSSNGSIDLAATNGTLPYEFSINNNAFSQQNSFTNLPAGSYTLIVKDANTCADTLQTSLTEPPAVLPPANIVSDTVCAGESATLQASGNGNLQWFDAANNLIGGGNSYSTEALLLNATFYVANSVGGCLSTPVPVNVVVVPLPVISPAVSSNSPLCEGATLQLNAPLIPNVSYEWFGPANFSSTQQSPAIANVSVKNNQGFYTLIVTDNASGCSSLPSSVLADITPQPQNILAAANGNICTGETLNLIASYFPNATYEWFGPSGFSSNVRNPSIQNATTNNAGIYSVIVSAANCAAVPATISVNVSAAPSVYAGNDTVISEGSFIQLNASGAYAYTWQPTNYLNNANSPNPVALLPVGEFELVVKGSSEAGCVSFDTVLVKVIENKNPTVYDLITPNGDGQNDRLSIPNIEKLSGYTLKIYARGGAVVLETKQYNNDWNATLNGKELPDGVYYYILELADGTILKGAITVIRN